MYNKVMEEVDLEKVGSFIAKLRKEKGMTQEDLAEIVGNELQKIQDQYHQIIQGSYIDDVLNKGAEHARMIARKKLAKVERKIGITIKK